MKIMHIFSSLLGTLLIAKGLGFFSWKPGFLNQNTSLKWFIDPHLFDQELSSFILFDYTYWAVGTGTFINFWNDKWCSTTPLAHIVGLSNGINIPDTISQFWIGCDWNLLLSLEQMPHLFSHIMVTADQDVPNWILDESGRSTLKSARTFFWN